MRSGNLFSFPDLSWLLIPTDSCHVYLSVVQYINVYILTERKKQAMTKLETSLLDILQEDCRTPLEKMAVMTGSTLEEVADAIGKLEERKIILRYSPVINWDRTDRERVEAMIEVRVTPQRDMGFDAIARRIYRFDEVKSVYLMSGSYDLLVLVEARTLKELAAFVSGKLSPLETVTGTATSFVLKRYKEEGVIFENDDTDRRLVISP
jgi:DNA-binding Lrp family transcriptional regulator